MNRLSVLLCLSLALGITANAWAENTEQLGEITVTGTREAQLKAETPATVDTLSGEEIRQDRPTHASQIMGRVPGVWVNITGGEGHQTAIRQPLTTSPVYLYLEDGIPTRSTGFFNHNALYEINIPQSSGIEVSKGPGTALYGSDAIGGVINVLTRPSPLESELEIGLEAGSFGWKRALLSAGRPFGDHGLRGDLNLTSTNGWRDATGYDRQSATVRWDGMFGTDASLKLVATMSNIDQQTAGTSTLSYADYINNPTFNYTPISLRKVQAFRLSAAYEQESESSLFSLTPYYRNDSMDLLPNWSLTYDPTIYNTSNQSFGLLTKYRLDFKPMRARLIFGIDMDYSPGGRTENSIRTTNIGAGATRRFAAYTTGVRIFDYDVTYQGIAPYLHGEISPLPAMRLTAGLRYDNITYKYSNNLAAGVISAVTSVGTKNYGHAANSTIRYNHLSPKLGMTYTFSDELNVFANYSHAFRAPSEGQLFRPSSTTLALAQSVALASTRLKPVKVHSYEVGLRGKAGSGFSYELSAYQMIKRDDIVRYRDPVTGARTSTNAGETKHQGIEVGIKAQLLKPLRLEIAYSYAEHTYEDWNAVVGITNINLGGKEIQAAPRHIANARLVCTPDFMNGGNFSAEITSLSNYWLDQGNTQKYGGHTLLNLSSSYIINDEWELFARISNVMDKRFAESGKVTGGVQQLAPGMPRAYYGGIQYHWKQ